MSQTINLQKNFISRLLNNLRKAKFIHLLKKINNIEMYSTYNEGKSVVAERFIRLLKKRFLSTRQLFQRMFFFFFMF